MNDPIYARIAVASTFSPRFEQVLAEAKRIRNRFGSQLHLIYVGEKSEATTERFAVALAEVGLPADSAIHYQDGGPTESILRAAEDNVVELIIAGALERTVVLRSFLGNVARRLVREANCSVMLFTKPERNPKPMCRIAFYVPPGYSEHSKQALQRTLHLAKREKCERLYVLRVYSSFDAARATLRANKKASVNQPAVPTLEEEERALEEFIDAAGATDVPIDARCIRSNTGFAASDFVQSVEADLLVVPVEVTHDSDGIPPHIAWVTDVIPCNLWIIR
ncbi:MAG: universal stress protein [Chthoniobacterales bacterium]